MVQSLAQNTSMVTGEAGGDSSNFFTGKPGVNTFYPKVAALANDKRRSNSSSSGPNG